MNPGSPRGLLDAVDLVTVPHLQGDINKMGVLCSVAGTMVETNPPPLHYLSLSRSPHQQHVLIDNAILSTDILNHHVVAGNLVVDLITHNSQQGYSPDHTLDRQYISDHYDSDLLSHSLGDEERIATQLVEFESPKTQHNDQETGVIVNGKSDTHSLGTIVSLHSNDVGSQHVISRSDMSPISYISDVHDSNHDLLENQVVVSHDSGMKLYHTVNEQHRDHIHRLPPLKKGMVHGIRTIPLSRYAQELTTQVNNLITTSTISAHATHLTDIENLSNHSTNIISLRQSNQHEEHKLLGNSLNGLNMLPHSGANIITSNDGSHAHIVNTDNLFTSSTQSIIISDQGGKVLVSQLNDDSSVKEEMDFEIKSFKSDEDDLFNESDGQSYALESDNERTTRQHSKSRSLPHKKRISRKLRNLEKGVPNKGNQTLNNIQLNPMLYSCELCGESFNSQLNFFEHLKFHYEPMPNSKEANQPSLRLSKSIQLQAPESLLHEEDQPVTDLSTIQTHNHQLDSINQEIQTASVTSEHYEEHNLMQIQEADDAVNSIVMNNLPGFVLKTLAVKCKLCHMTFRRQKALESHMREIHYKDNQMEEFSEPEDFMEGIRGVVEVNDSDEDKINLGHSNKAAREWYHVDELHATEADLEELEAEQIRREALEKGQTLLPTHDYNCTLCGEKFTTKHLFSEHQKDCIYELSGDESDRPAKAMLISCAQCGRPFNHRNSLIYHMQSHTGERPFQCDKCGKSFLAASALKVHMRMHTGAKPFQCKLCPKKFRQWGDLNYHKISIHTDQKQFQCEFCGKDFARKYSLVVHRRIHTGEKNYKCEFCPKTFRASSYLQNHRKIHTGEKPYPCTICGKPFRVRGDMKRHMNTHNRSRGPITKSSPNHSISKLDSSPKEDIVDDDDNCDSLNGDIKDIDIQEHRKCVTPKTEIMTPSYMQEQEQNVMSLAPIEITISSTKSGEVDGNICSPRSPKPIDLNVTSTSKSPSSDNSHQDAVLYDCETDHVLRYREQYINESNRDSNSTVLLWPVNMKM